MSAVKFELENLSPEGFRHELASDSDITLTCLTEYSADSCPSKLQNYKSASSGKLTFRLICLSVLMHTYTFFRVGCMKINVDLFYLMVE